MAGKEIDTTIGERIIFVIGGTQKEIGVKLGVSQDTVSLWKRGKTPTIEHINKVIDIAQVDYSWLTTGKSKNIEMVVNGLFPLHLKADRQKMLREIRIILYTLTINFYNLSKIDIKPELPVYFKDTIHFVAVALQSAYDLSFPNLLEPPKLIDIPDWETNPELRIPSEGECNISEYQISGFEYSRLLTPSKKYISKATKLILNISEGYDPTDTNIQIKRESEFIEKNALYTQDGNIDYQATFKKLNLFQEEENSLHNKAIQLPDIAPEDFREIPFYPDEIAAGQPLEIRDAPEGIVIIHKNWCKQPEHMVAVRVSSTGTSMEPTIPAGAIVTIDTSMTAPKTLLGQPVAIYKKDDGATIKRLAQTTKGWCGIPDNRDPIHQVIMLEDGDRIIGKVNSVHYAL